ncbi:MAG: protein-L-isoaspartate(D-aspartate) O-methyltransferase [Sphingomonadaceae bacterium]
MTEEHLAVLRRHMVELIDIHYDLASEEIGKDSLDEPVREAMLRAPRHIFVPEQLAAFAYHDRPLPIGFDKTISQPFIGALMLDLLDVERDQKILEVGTGLGYQAALLAEMGARLWSVEIVEEFASAAGARLAALGMQDVVLRSGDGSRGWPDKAPFDRILVTAAAAEPPEPLIDQLADEGRMVIPLGGGDVQQLSVLSKNGAGETETRAVLPVRFTMLEVA